MKQDQEQREQESLLVPEDLGSATSIAINRHSLKRSRVAGGRESSEKA